ncbi:START-like domain-containing protein [Artemisia annua]|uniref:START-like domain-containing protein n=1 Tax=Artemisia annua TaxID=35608 RepID=A0A2U1LPL2_ARTAN|nr:START-like domain-containing protein [Artemisia annua]
MAATYHITCTKERHTYTTLKRLDEMLYVGLTDHRESTTMFANLGGAQQLGASKAATESERTAQPVLIWQPLFSSSSLTFYSYNLVTWTAEYEKLSPDVPDPDMLMDFYTKLPKDIETHHLKN